MVFKKLVAVLLIFTFFSCGNKDTTLIKSSHFISNNAQKALLHSKIKGLSYVTPYREEGQNLKAIKDLGANWIALSPFALVKKGESWVKHDNEYEWKAIKESCRLAKENQLKIMLKPQLWGHDMFTGHINFKKEEDWQQFEKDYAYYILDFAKIAENQKLEMFCIGTELAEFVRIRPLFWKQLIKDIRAIYSGKLTYAENWDALEKFPFWKDLDFIGSDAYYPLSVSEYPTVKELNQAWIKWKNKLALFSNEQNRKILFTEWGYRSSVENTKKPWDFSAKKAVSEENQANAYQSVFESIYQENWFVGGFVWKWHPHLTDKKHIDDTFTPQGKLGEQKLKEWFSK